MKLVTCSKLKVTLISPNKFSLVSFVLVLNLRFKFRNVTAILQLNKSNFKKYYSVILFCVFVNILYFYENDKIFI